MKDNTIVSVELTTMGNLVAKTSRNKHQNPIKMQLTLPFFISDDKNLQKNLKNLKGQEINREIKEIKEFNYGKKLVIQMNLFNYYQEKRIMIKNIP